MKKFLIHQLDKLDHYVIRHRWYWLCSFIHNCSWWGECECYCDYCRKLKEARS